MAENQATQDQQQQDQQKQMNDPSRSQETYDRGFMEQISGSSSTSAVTPEHLQFITSSYFQLLEDNVRQGRRVWEAQTLGLYRQQIVADVVTAIRRDPSLLKQVGQ